jgi:xanthine dehydrogenase accessory factor
VLEAIVAARAGRRPIVRLLWLETGEERLVEPVGIGSASVEAELAGLGSELGSAVKRAVRRDRAERVEFEAGAVFVQPFNPPLRLAIIGGVHIAQHLARLALDLGYAVTLIDPRRGFLTEARFPGVERSHLWPDEALTAFAPDARSAVVTLSHDAKIDEPALEIALDSPCFYVGALGSQRTQARRRDRLRERGLSEEALARIHGPVGLDLGAQSPAEIALSIAAQITGVLRGQG